MCSWILRRQWRSPRRLSLAAVVILTLGALASLAIAQMNGATMGHAATDLAMTQAPRSPRNWRESVIPPAPYLLLAGDLHCHINPPDWSEQVAAPVEGRAVSIEVAPDECSVLRATVDGGYSAPIYVNCPFARIADL
ncbi:MAG: hypothetical protein ACMG6S_14285 [Byssovorax sp.]